LFVVVPVVISLNDKFDAEMEQVARTCTLTSKLPVAVAAKEGAAKPSMAVAIEVMIKRFMVTRPFHGVWPGFGQNSLTSQQEGES
jgi:hypothetical protein